MPPSNQRELIRVIDRRIQHHERGRRTGGIRSHIARIEAQANGTKLKAATTGLAAGDEQEQTRPGRLVQHYGLASRPLPDAEAVVLPVDGRSGQGVIIGTEDPRYRPELDDGEVVLFDHLGQLVHLKEDGTIAVTAKGNLVLNNGSDAVAGTGDSVAPTAAMASWISAVSTALGLLPPPSTFGSISETGRTVKV